MTDTRVLVTGANGFMGRRLLPKLLDRGLPVTAAVRTKPPHEAPFAGVRWVALGDIGPETDWGRVLDGVGVVINLAGRAHVLSERAADPEADFMRVNCDAAVGLYAAAAQAGARGFIQLSSIGVLGSRTERGRPFTDDSPPLPVTPYGRSKAAAETALARLAASGGPALVILRPPLICGSGAKGNLARLLGLADTPLPLPFAGIGNRRSLLSLDNMCDAIEAVLDRWRDGAASGTFVIADAAPVSTAEIVTALRQGLGRPPRLLPVSPHLMGRALRLIGAGGISEQLLGDLEVDASGFRRAFGWSPGVSTLDTLVAAGRDHRRRPSPIEAAEQV